MRKLTIVLALLIFSSPAWGEQKTIKGLLEIYDKAPLKFKYEINKMLNLASVGMAWSNAELEGEGRQPLYCPPEKLVITGEQAFQIFRTEVERRKRTNDPFSNAGIYLLKGLIRTFPCK